MNKSKIHLSAYANYKVTCIIGTRKELCEYMLKKYDSVTDLKEVDGEYFKIYSDGGEITKGIIFLNSAVLKKNRLETLVHESLHCAERIMGLLKIKTDPDNHEALAYLQGSIFSRFYKKNIKFFASKGVR